MRAGVWISAFVVACLLPLQAEAATVIADPANFVKDLFHRMSVATAEKPYVPPEDIYTSRLAGLMALDKHEAGDEVGRLDFDIWTGAQDWELSGVRISTQAVEGAKNREIVVAKFKNGGKPYVIHYYFERAGGAWKLDDVREVSPEPWTLSLVLKYGWDDAP
jgi:hypothetical protein